MDRLDPLDALFVDAEDADPHTSMAITSIAVFEGPAPSHEEFLAYLARRLPRVPPASVSAGHVSGRAWR
jgi:diacylglycerol O-acyltransferase / wax synthase